VLAPLLRELSVALWVAAAFLGLPTIYWSSKLDVHWYVSTLPSHVVSNLPIVVGAVLPLLLWTAIERERAAAEAGEPEAELRDAREAPGRVAA